MCVASSNAAAAREDAGQAAFVTKAEHNRKEIQDFPVQGSV